MIMIIASGELGDPRIYQCDGPTPDSSGRKWKKGINGPNCVSITTYTAIAHKYNKE